MKRIRYAISLLLIVAVLCASMPVSYAVHDIKYSSLAKKFSASDIVSLDVYPVERFGVELLCVEYKNGDVLFAEFDTTGMIASRLLSEKTCTEYVKYYKNGRVVEAAEDPYVTLSPYEMRAGVETGTLGNIYYSYTDGELSGICSARISYAHRDGTTTHDFNAQYRTVTELASWIVKMFAIGARMAGLVAADILNCASFVIKHAGYYAFPERPLACSYDHNVFTATNNANTSNSNSFGGTCYTFVADDYSYSCVDETEDYYSLRAFSQREYSFAATVYTYLFPYAYWSVHSWG